MANAHSFPLLRLPFLALEPVIKQMYVREQFDLSTLSKRAQRVVRASTSRQKFEVILEFGFIVKLNLRSSNSTFMHAHETEFPTGAQLEELITKVSDAFKTLCVQVCIDGFQPSLSVFELISFCKNLKIPLNELSLNTDLCPNDELCEQALNAGAKRLYLNCDTSDNFIPQGLGSLELEHLDIVLGCWVSSEHLINHFINCRHVKLSLTKLSVGDVNEFFKKWMEGSKMRNFIWEPLFDQLREIKCSRILDGIPCVGVKRARIREGMKEFEDDAWFMIERADGVRALVYKEIYSICMTTEFSLD